MKSPKIIAEIGCNHKGDMAIAKEMTEEMGGKIEAELNDNIFKVSLFFKRL